VRLRPDNQAHREWMKRMSAFIFDMDGVLYTFAGGIDGAAKALSALQGAGKTVLFMTNNPTKTQEEVVSSLSTRKSFKANSVMFAPDEIMTAAVAAADYLASKGLKGAKVYVAGMAGLAKTLREKSGVIAFGANDDDAKTKEDCVKEFLPRMDPPPEDVAAVVVGEDFRFNYYKVTRAANYLRQNPKCLFVSTNPDPRALLGGNIVVPATSAIVAAIAETAGRWPIMTCGKPSAVLAQQMLQSRGLDPRTTCMVGDRTDTDIAFGRNVGMQTVWVESGSMSEVEARRSDEACQPHFMAPSIATLAQLL